MPPRVANQRGGEQEEEAGPSGHPGQMEIMGQLAQTGHAGYVPGLSRAILRTKKGKPMKVLMKKVGGGKKARMWNMAQFQPRRWRREQEQLAKTEAPAIQIPQTAPALPQTSPIPITSVVPSENRL